MRDLHCWDCDQLMYEYQFTAARTPFCWNCRNTGSSVRLAKTNMLRLLLPGAIRSAYIAGPMRGYPMFNFPMFDLVRDFLKAMGLSVISPADLDRANGISDMGADLSGKELDLAIERDIQAILRTQVVILLPGWQYSTGAKAELCVAKWSGRKAYEWPSMVEVKG